MFSMFAAHVEQEELESVLDSSPWWDSYFPQRPQIFSSWEQCKNRSALYELTDHLDPLSIYLLFALENSL